MEMEDILAFKKLTASITGNDLNNISGSTLSDVVDNCVMTVILRDVNEASKVNYVKFNDYLINPETGTFYTAVGDNFDHWKVVSADTNQEVYKCYNRSFDIKITESCAIIAVYQESDTMWTVSLKDGNNSTTQAVVQNNGILVDSSNNLYKAMGENFAYWSVFTSDNGKEVARCYYKSFNLRIYDNYTIVAVYNVEPKSLISISKPRYSREQSTNEEGTVVKDSLYVDFMVAYMSADGDLIRDDTSGSKYQTGVIVELGQYKVLGTNENGTVNTDYSKFTYESDIEQVKIATTTGYGQVTKYSYNDDTSDKRKLYNFRATNTNYNNMNRLDYAVCFTNTPTNQMFVYKAYYYVIVDGEVILSEPVYFNLYEVGTSTPTTVTTNS